MRDYSKVSPKYWTGETGKQIRKLGPTAQVISMYLFTGPMANMLGLYYLNLPNLCHETGTPLEGALEALRSLENIGFAYYDPKSEHVYLPNMAREQIGEALKEKDNRVTAIRKELESLRKTPFFNDFVERYRDAYRLHDIHINKVLPRPSEGGTNPLARGSEAPANPLRSQEQEQEQKQEQEHICGGETVEKGRDPDPPRPAPPLTIELTDAEHHQRFLQLMAKYPAYVSAPNPIMVEATCRTLVNNGEETWDTLDGHAERFWTFVDRGGRSEPLYVDHPLKFFKDPVFRRAPWDPPKSKAEKRLDKNLAAAEQAKRELLEEESDDAA